MRSDSAFAESRTVPSFRGTGMLAIQSLRLPRSSEAWFGIAVPVPRALGSANFDK